MSLIEKILFLGGLAVIWGYPLYFLVAGAQWFLLLVYVIATTGCAMTLRMFLCSECMNFACPLNTVNEAVRHAFFKNNPDIAKAWNYDVG